MSPRCRSVLVSFFEYQSSVDTGNALLFTVYWKVSKLADRRDVMFYGSDIIYIDRKNGPLCHRPHSGGLGIPFP